MFFTHTWTGCLLPGSISPSVHILWVSKYSGPSLPPNQAAFRDPVSKWVLILLGISHSHTMLWEYLPFPMFANRSPLSSPQYFLSSLRSYLLFKSRANLPKFDAVVFSEVNWSGAVFFGQMVTSSLLPYRCISGDALMATRLKVLRLKSTRTEVQNLKTHKTTGGCSSPSRILASEGSDKRSPDQPHLGLIERACFKKWSGEMTEDDSWHPFWGLHMHANTYTCTPTQTCAHTHTLKHAYTHAHHTDMKMKFKK